MPNDFLNRLNKNSSLTDVLIQIEDFLDGLDLYVFKNWINGEVIEGPHVERYWVSITLMYELKEMPDPQGGMRLIKHGAKVKYEKATRSKAKELQSPSDYRSDRKGKPKMEEEDVWLVSIIIPRKFIEELDDDDLELYNQDVDTDSVSDARDENIDAKDAYQDGEQLDNPDDEVSDEEEQ